jgi:hypothetical protein
MGIIFFLLLTPQQHIDERRKIEKKELVGKKPTKHRKKENLILHHVLFE